MDNRTPRRSPALEVLGLVRHARDGSLGTHMRDGMLQAGAFAAAIVLLSLFEGVHVLHGSSPQVARPIKHARGAPTAIEAAVPAGACAARWLPFPLVTVAAARTAHS